MTCRWDNSQVLALQEAEQAKWERASNALRAGGITVNDFRRVVGLDTDPAGDVFLLPRGSVPLPMGALPQPGDVIGALPPGEQPGTVQGAPPPLREIRVASYADQFLDDLSRKRLAHVNGHSR